MRVDHASLAVGDLRLAAPDAKDPPLVIHLVYRFDTGGLENGVVNLINHMPATAYRHAVVALTEVVPAFAARIRRDDVQYLSLHKPPGHGFKLYPRLLRLLREWRPAIVHTRNLAALECQVIAQLAGVPARVHSEHGRDLAETRGRGGRYRLMRRLYRPFVDQYVAVSRDLADYLVGEVGVSKRCLNQIYNGVDSATFVPSRPRASIAGCPFNAPGFWLVGTVGRMQPIKGQTLLARAFIRALNEHPALAERLRLIMVGEGPLRTESQALLDAAGVGHLAWLPGERSDVPNVMQGLDCFVLPSLSEGISNTILEAMSCGLPVVATDVGGNADLVVAGRSGMIVPVEDAQAIASCLTSLFLDAGQAETMGCQGRLIVEERFSLSKMVNAYNEVYDRALAGRQALA